MRDSSGRSSGVKVVVAMSGGVDSSVAAAALAADGYDVTGVTFVLWRAEGGPGASSVAAGELAAGDAGAVCRALGVPHRVIDLRSEFKKVVVEPFCREYLAGRTPNPCVVCNPGIKFAALAAAADDLGARFFATGHHVREILVPETGTYRLLKGVDRGKDQSYALWRLTQSVLNRTAFPIGWMMKSEVRATARRLDLPVAERDESQDACFLSGGDISGLVGEVLPGVGSVLEGEIRDLKENVLGRHRGYFNFTVGQRRGLNLARGRRQYIVRLDPRRNIVYVGDDDDLKHRVAHVSGFSFVEGSAGDPSPGGPSRTTDASRPPRGMDGGAVTDERASGSSSEDRGPGLRVTAKIRYMHPGAPGWLGVAGDGSAVMRFDEPQRAITPGQSLVAYVGERLLGGGVIERSER
jgi:tRNA-specific 2-thiouridylase